MPHKIPFFEFSKIRLAHAVCQVIFDEGDNSSYCFLKVKIKVF
jgi:hypothetical protein